MLNQLELVQIQVEKSLEDTFCINAKIRFSIIENRVFNETSHTLSSWHR